MLRAEVRRTSQGQASFVCDTSQRAMSGSCEANGALGSARGGPQWAPMWEKGRPARPCVLEPFYPGESADSLAASLQWRSCPKMGETSPGIHIAHVQHRATRWRSSQSANDRLLAPLPARESFRPAVQPRRWPTQEVVRPATPGRRESGCGPVGGVTSSPLPATQE